MAAAEKYAQWIVANQDKRGTPEFDTVAAAYKAAREQPLKVDAPQPQEPSLWGELKQAAGNVAGGLVGGAGSIGATIVAPGDMLTDLMAGKGLSLESNRQRRKDLAGALSSFGAETDSIGYQGGKIGSEVMGTLAIGGPVAKAVQMGANAMGLGAKAAPLVQAVATSGFRTGAPVATTLGGKAANVGIRATGGAITGAAAGGTINPADAPVSAGIGALLPPAVQGIGKTGQLIGQGYRSVMTPQDVKLANKLAQSMGISADELSGVLQGPQMIPGYKPTLPQIVQDPVASQLQRTLKTAGANALGDAERVQQAQYVQALERVAPIGLSVQDAADRAGNVIKNYAVSARKNMSQEVRDAFDAVDPENETALFLPIDEMTKAQATYLGPGTFGTGSKAQAAIDAARQAGTETIEATKPLSAKGVQDLVLAVRAAGGINTSSKAGKGLSGEIRNLRESGLKNIVRPNTGLSVERMAERMHESGFLPDNDPATLLDLLHESAAGNKIYASGSDDAYRMAMEASQGMPPSGTFAKTVPFQTVQNLRASIGEAAEQALAKGANKEAAALHQMVAEIDSRINRAVGGSAEAGEHFPQEITQRYRNALDLHAKKMAQFETGPQVGIFRKGGDGQASIQGAEIPGKFYNSRRSQVEDVQALKRLIGNEADLMAEMKHYAVTEGAKTKTAGGDLTSEYIKWLESRSGANRELFNEQELATLKEVGKAVERSMKAENLGRVSGPDTAQKLNALNNLGALDSRAVDFIANRIPGVRVFAGPMLDGLRQTATQTRNNKLATLLANPEHFAEQLAKAQANKLMPVEYDPLWLRAMPAVSSNRLNPDQ